jgi:hypothetical protein
LAASVIWARPITETAQRQITDTTNRRIMLLG